MPSPRYYSLRYPKCQQLRSLAHLTLRPILLKAYKHFFPHPDFEHNDVFGSNLYKQYPSAYKACFLTNGQNGYVVKHLYVQSAKHANNANCVTYRLVDKEQ